MSVFGSVIKLSVIGSYFCNALKHKSKKKQLQLKNCSILKKGLLYSCFPKNFAKIFTKPYLKNTSRQLCLDLAL